MAINTTQLTVGTTAVRVDPTRPGQMIPRGSMVIRNRGESSIWLGGSGVTVNNGYLLEPGEALTADLAQGDAIFAVAAETGQLCHVLQVGGAS